MIALSTRFAHGLSPEEAVGRFERSGASAVVLDRDVPPPFWEQKWPVLAVESPSPRTRASSAHLSSADRDEWKTALEAALDTVRRAAGVGARFVAIQLGEIRSMEREWRFARDRFLRGQLEERVVQGLLKQRRAESERPLDGARRALDRLARAAESEGLTLSVANGRRFTALPDARELDLLLQDLSGAPVEPLFDVPAAQLPHLMGFQPLALTQAAFAPGRLVYWGDACGPLGALPPGHGDMDLSQIKLAENAERVFSPWSGLTVEESLEAVSRLS